MSLSQREKEQRLSAYIDELNAGRSAKGESEQDDELRSLMDTTVRIRALKDTHVTGQPAQSERLTSARTGTRVWVWVIAALFVLFLAAAFLTTKLWLPPIHAIME